MNRIKCIRSALKMSQTTFAQLFHVDQTAVSNWEKGKNGIDYGIAEQISEHFHVPVEFIYGKPFSIKRPFAKWHDDELEDYEHAPADAKPFIEFTHGKGYFPTSYENDLEDDEHTQGIKIPVLGRVAAGIPITAITDILDYEEISPEMIKDGSEYFALSIKGDSMEPKISEGDVVIVRKQEDCESGQIAIVQINGDEATCKKLVKKSNGIVLQSFNPAYEPMYFSAEEIEELPLKVIGRVVELRAKF